MRRYVRGQVARDRRFGAAAPLEVRSEEVTRAGEGSVVFGEFRFDRVELSHDDGNGAVTVYVRAPCPGGLERGRPQRGLHPFCDRLPPIGRVGSDRDHLLGCGVDRRGRFVAAEFGERDREVSQSAVDRGAVVCRPDPAKGGPTVAAPPPPAVPRGR